MTTEPSRNYVEGRLLLADEMLHDARMLLEKGSLRSAADRAYYAMFHASQAALLSQGIAAPRSHQGLRSAFGKHLIIPGKIERQFGRALTRAFRLRQESSYEAYARRDEETVADLVARAFLFVERMRKLISSVAT